MASDPRPVVLVAEDEDMVRLVAAMTVNDLGYETLEASNSNEAARIIEKNPEVSILFADIQMPGSIDGMNLADYVHRRWPHIRIILTSGRVPEASVILPPGSAFLAKPYTHDALANQLAAFAA